jgi:hypothetical protein
LQPLGNKWWNTYRPYVDPARQVRWKTARQRTTIFDCNKGKITTHLYKRMAGYVGVFVFQQEAASNLQIKQ